MIEFLAGVAVTLVCLYVGVILFGLALWRRW